MSIALAVLGFGRAMTESRMTETVEIVADVAPVVNHDTLAAERPASATLYTGKAQIVYKSDAVARVDVASRVAAVQTPMLKLPVSDLLPDRAIVRVTASATDPSLVGREYRISGAPDSGSVTAHRYHLVEVRP